LKLSKAAEDDSSRFSTTREDWKHSGSVAAEDGVLLWDAANGYPVVSKDGVWRQITLADGYALLNKATTINSCTS
jgi:hypothetical protein